MKLSKKALAGVLSALTIAVMAAGCGEEAKIGYINSQRLNEECPQIKADTDEWQNKLDELENTARTELSEAEAKGASKEEVDKIQNNIRMKAVTLNNEFQNKTKAKVDKAIDEVAKEKNIDTVVGHNEDKEVIYVGGVDITDDVIKKLQ